MRRFKLVPDHTTFDFMRWRKLAVGMSLVMILGTVGLVATMGFNFGIDFRGGIMIEARTEGPADIAGIRAAARSLELGDVAVQEYGDPTDVLIRIEAQQGEGDAQMKVVTQVESALKAAYGSIEFRRVEVVGPKVSGELVWQGVLALAAAVVGMLIYVWLRFEWQFALGSVLALVHDVALTVGVFSLAQLEFNLSIIAALLTIVGYSMNDTVIVFDRIRENLRKYKQMPLTEVLNLSINETLSRTLMTSGTTLIALIALWSLGGEVIRGFTFAMIWGIVVGTYSSIFIASVLVLRTGVKRDWSKPDTTGPAGTNYGGAQV